jgi:hypothetical protein
MSSRSDYSTSCGVEVSTIHNRGNNFDVVTSMKSQATLLQMQRHRLKSSGPACSVLTHRHDEVVTLDSKRDI